MKIKKPDLGRWELLYSIIGLYRVFEKKCRIFWEVVVPIETSKKSPINLGPETHTFWVMYTCSVTQDVRLWMSASVIDKVNI